MDETQQQPTSYREEKFEDEIELMDYLRVVWKRKWLIIVGTLFSILAVVIYSFTRPVIKMYRISALVEVDPRFVEANPEDELVLLDKIKSMIEYGLFNQRIIDNLSKSQDIGKLQNLSFQVAIRKALNMLDIAYESTNVDLGKTVLNLLIKQLEQEYAQQARSQFDKKLDEITKHIVWIKEKKDEIKLIEATIDQTKRVLLEAQSTSDKLSAKRKIALLNADAGTHDANIFMQAAAINQVMEYPLELRDRIHVLSSSKNRALREIMSEIRIIKDLAVGVTSLSTEVADGEGEDNFVLKLKREIDSFRYDRGEITCIIVTQPPTAKPIPIKNRAKHNVVLATVVGFLAMVLLAFFMEYIQRHRAESEP